jgi:hypothetical protein
LSSKNEHFSPSGAKITSFFLKKTVVFEEKKQDENTKFFIFDSGDVNKVTKMQSFLVYL